MKEISFTRTVDAIQHIVITIKDEEKFIELLKEQIQEQGLEITIEDLDDFDTDVVSIRWGDIDWENENDDEFLEVMMDNDYPTSSEDLED
jgi:ABC-type metal ion transport system substrate-binding protein